MSYSFNAKGSNKDEAKAAVAAEFDKIVEMQPIHARDREAALANANAMIDLLVDDDTMDIAVSCHGYVGWRGVMGADPEPLPLNGASASAMANHVARETT